MVFEFIINEADSEASHKMDFVRSFSKRISKAVLNKSYGFDVQELLLVCICVKTRPSYEEWFKIRKPRYTDYKVFKNLFGEDVEIKKQLIIETRIDGEEYDKFIEDSDEESKKILINKVLESLTHLDTLPKKVKDFDKERFKTDIEQFFKEQDLI